jgi:hypothetical protein
MAGPRRDLWQDDGALESIRPVSGLTSWTQAFRRESGLSTFPRLLIAVVASSRTPDSFGSITVAGAALDLRRSEPLRTSFP